MESPGRNERDLEISRHFLEQLLEEVPGILELRLIVPDGAVRRKWHTSVTAAMHTIKWEVDAENVYFAVATRQTRESGAKDNLQAVRALWIDADFDDDRDREKFHSALQSFPLSPSVRVASSGNGEHAYWCLDEPFALENDDSIGRFEHVLRGLADALGTDRAVTDATRVMRVPGTVNYPDKKKQEKGREAARCELLEVNDHRYRFDDFDAFELRGEKLRSNPAPVIHGDQARDGTVPVSVAAIFKRDPKVQARFERSIDGLERTSPSEVDMSLASMLAHRGVPPPEIEAALRASRSKAGLDLKHEAYYGRTVSKAGQKADQVEGFSPYSVRNGVITYTKMTKDGPVDQQLCNFSARIVSEQIHDDGVEENRRFVLEGSLRGGTTLASVEVPAERFASLNWIPSAWGTRAIVHAGASAKDHLRCAIQTLSGAVPQATVYTHLGWRKLTEGWVYLHSGGAIGGGGAIEGVSVGLPEALARYELPTPEEKLVESIRASLNLLEVAPDRVMMPLLSMVYRSVIDTADFSGHVSGQTGAGKTELAALMQAHFGAELDSRRLPASWSSTGNALEGLAFAAKDALLVVDDFAPHGSTSDVLRQHREADRVLRAQGNRSGRARMWADGTLRQVRPPRGMILSTGEDIPAGQSLRARILVVEVGPSDVGWDRLTGAQQAAAQGLLAQALAGFVQWLAPRLETARRDLGESVSLWREQSLSHRRSPDILGHLAAGFRLFLAYATEAGALSSAEVQELQRRAEAALIEVGQAQAEQQQDADPVERFLRLLAASLASGDAHVADADGNAEPSDPEDWGWRARIDRKGQSEMEIWEPQGKRMGWVREDDLYLEGDAAFAVAQQMAARQGSSLAVSPRTLWKRMEERDLLVSHEQGRYTARPLIAGRQQRVVHLSKGLLSARTGLTGLCGLQPSETEGEAVRSDSRPELEPEPSSDRATNRATDRARESAEMEGTRRSGSPSPLSPVSPIGGEEIPREERGRL